MAADHWHHQSSAMACPLGQSPLRATLPHSTFRLSNAACDDSPGVVGPAASGGRRLATQMGGLTVTISEDRGSGLLIGSSSGKESFIYSPEERMQAIQRVLMEDESLQISDGFQGLQMDSPFPYISDLIPATPAALQDERCVQLQGQQEKNKSTYFPDSFQLPTATQVETKDRSSGPALPIGLREETITDIPMKVKKGSRHNLGERERRKEINDLICTLQAFLPQRVAKMDKATVLSESLEYIKGLQKKLSDLQNRKAKIVEIASHSNRCPNEDAKTTNMVIPCSDTYVQTLNSQNVSAKSALVHRRVRIDSSLTIDRGYFQKFSTNNMSVNVSGDTVYFYLRSPSDVVLEEIMKLLQKQQLDIVRVEICMNDSRFKELSIQARARRTEVLLTNDFLIALIQRSCLSIY